MTDPRPPKVQPVDATSSLARRSGADIRLVLHLPRAGYPSGPVRLRLWSAGEEAIHDAEVAPAEPGVVVTAVVPAQRLGTGVWSIGTVTDGGDPLEEIQARLLTSSTQPIALLPGPAPETRMRPPLPRAAPRRRDTVRAVVPRPLVRVLRAVRGRLGRMGT